MATWLLIMIGLAIPRVTITSRGHTYEVSIGFYFLSSVVFGGKYERIYQEL